MPHWLERMAHARHRSRLDDIFLMDPTPFSVGPDGTIHVTNFRMQDTS